MTNVLEYVTLCRQDSNLHVASTTTGPLNWTYVYQFSSLRVIGVMTSDSDVEPITLITIVKHTSITERNS